MVRLGRHANLIMGGGPHMSTRLSSWGPGSLSAIMASEIKPEENFHRAGGRSSVYHTLKRVGCLAAYL